MHHQSSKTAHHERILILSKICLVNSTNSYYSKSFISPYLGRSLLVKNEEISAAFIIGWLLLVVVERVPDPNPTFFGLPEPDFSMSGMYPTLNEPDFMKKHIKFGVKSA